MKAIKFDSTGVKIPCITLTFPLARLNFQAVSSCAILPRIHLVALIHTLVDLFTLQTSIKNFFIRQIIFATLLHDLVLPQQLVGDGLKLFSEEQRKHVYNRQFWWVSILRKTNTQIGGDNVDAFKETRVKLLKPRLALTTDEK